MHFTQIFLSTISYAPLRLAVNYYTMYEKGESKNVSNAEADIKSM